MRTLVVRCAEAGGAVKVGSLAVAGCTAPWSCRTALGGWARGIAETEVA